MAPQAPPKATWDDSGTSRMFFGGEVAKGSLLAEVRANRLSALDLSDLRFSSAKGTLEVAGRTLRAELLGTFTGQAWLWSWANPFLALPPERTQIARQLQALATRPNCDVLAVPHLVTDERADATAFGVLAVAEGLADGYVWADDLLLVAIAPGELAGITIAEPLASLREALQSDRELQQQLGTADDAANDWLSALAGNAGADLPDDAQRAEMLAKAARELGLTVERVDDDWTLVRDRVGGSLRVYRDGSPVESFVLARCFCSKSVTVDDVAGHVRAYYDGTDDREVDVDGETITVAGEGLTLRLHRIDEPRAFEVEVEVTPAYEGSMLTVGREGTPDVPDEAVGLVEFLSTRGLEVFDQLVGSWLGAEV